MKLCVQELAKKLLMKLLMVVRVLINNSIVIKNLPLIDYTETESFKTDIFTSQNGTEKRVKLVDTPKRTVSAKIKATTENEMQQLEEIIAYALKYDCYMPLWFSQVFSQNGGNSDTIECDTALSSFKSNEYALISDKCAKVIYLDSTYITIDKTLIFSKNTRIVPLVRMRPNKSTAYTFINKKIGDFILNFEEVV
ncbi:MAG: hypothetical protein ACK5LP_00990 [Campylobacteraceae bacterium]